MKYISYAAIALAASAFVACESDRDDNPTFVGTDEGAQVEFTLCQPTFATMGIDLANTDSLLITWNQPEFGFPIACAYHLQVSATGNFTTSYQEKCADETIESFDYYQFDAVSGTSANFGARDINRALAYVNNWTDESLVPEDATAYLRIKAVPAAAVDLGSVTSNVISLKTFPVYVALKDADPVPWYLIGACIGDGKWTNTPEALGISTLPMGIIDGEKYNANTGAGNFTWSGYITTDGFKLISTLGSWDEQWGMNDGAFVFKDGGSGNIVVDVNGYYTVTLNTEDGSDPVVTPMETAPKVYEALAIAGTFNEWNTTDNLLTPINTVTPEQNHMWSYELAGPTMFKILTPGDWGTNWGGTAFPVGVGVNGGGDISLPEGNWRVIFNDVDGSFFFMSLD